MPEFWTFQFGFYLFEDCFVLVVSLQKHFLLAHKFGNSLVYVVVVKRFTCKSTFSVSCH